MTNLEARTCTFCGAEEVWIEILDCGCTCLSCDSGYWQCPRMVSHAQAAALEAENKRLRALLQHIQQIILTPTVSDGD